MSTIKINQLATGTVESTNFIITADDFGVAKKTTVESLSNLMSETLASNLPYSFPIGFLDLPTDFKNQLNAQVYYNGYKFSMPQANVASIDFTLANNHTKYFVNYVTGSNSNNGLSSATAFKTYAKACDAVQALGSPAEIILEDEYIGYLSILSTNETFSSDIKISSGSPSGRTVVTQMRESYAGNYNWTNNGDGSFSSNQNVADYTAMFDNKFTDSDGVAKPMKSVSTSQEVSNELGTFHFDGTNIHIQMWDSREPDTEWINCQFSNRIRIFNTNDSATVILENLTTYTNNGSSPNDGFSGRCQSHTGVDPNTAKLGIKNCISAGASGNGFYFTDFSIAIYEDCVAKYNRKDGFNYHSLAGLVNGNYITVYEINCKSENQGWDGYFTNQPTQGISNNGSTAHDNINIVRVNCVHTNTFGPVIADVGGCDSLNYGVTAQYPNLTNAVLPNSGASAADRKTNATFYYLGSTGTSPKRFRVIGGKGDNRTNGDALAFTLSNDDSVGDFEIDSWLGGTRTEYGTITDI